MKGDQNEWKSERKIKVKSFKINGKKYFKRRDCENVKTLKMFKNAQNC